MAQAIWGIAVLLFLVAAVMRMRRRKHGARTFDVGPGAMGSVYDLLNQDRRNATELIVEKMAEARDPEDKDGNLPELQRPKRPATRQ